MGYFPDLKLLKFMFYNLKHYLRREVFANICIETYSPCNRTCSCCPVGYEKRPVTQMPEELFRQIIDQLAQRKYRGEIGLHFYNEPTLDKRLLKFIDYAHKKCPRSYLTFASNGDYLDIVTFREWVRAGLSHINISQYDKTPKPVLSKFLEEATPEDRKFFTCSVRVIDDFPNWRNRAGNLPKWHIQEPLKKKCMRPDRQLIINAEGKVAQCCCDYHASQDLGDARKQNVFEIWRSDKFRAIRALLRQGNRAGLDLCHACDWYEETISLPRERPRGELPSPITIGTRVIGQDRSA